MNTTTLLAPIALVAGLFATQSQAHDVVVSAALPGVSVIIGTPPPPPPVYVAPAPRQVVYVEPAPVQHVHYRRPAPAPVVVVERPRYVDDRCDHRDFRDAKHKHKHKHGKGHGRGRGHDHHNQYAAHRR